MTLGFLWCGGEGDYRFPVVRVTLGFLWCGGEGDPRFPVVWG